MSNTSELDWFKSSYSSAQGDDCVEATVTEQTVLVRDSKDKDGPRLAVSRDGWARFVRFAAHG